MHTAKFNSTHIFNLIKVAREKIVKSFAGWLAGCGGRLNVCTQPKPSSGLRNIYHFIMCTHTQTPTYPIDPTHSQLTHINIKWYLVHEKELMTAHLICSIFHKSHGTHTYLQA